MTGRHGIRHANSCTTVAKAGEWRDHARETAGTPRSRLEMSLDRRGMLVGGAASVLASSAPSFVKAQTPQKSRRPDARQAPGQRAPHPPDHTIRIETGPVELERVQQFPPNSTMAGSPGRCCALSKGSASSLIFITTQGWSPILGREGHVCEDIVLTLVHQGGELGHRPRSGSATCRQVWHAASDIHDQ